MICRTKKGRAQYLVKWKELPYLQCSWEDLAKETYLKGWREAIDDYNNLRCVREREGGREGEREGGREGV